MHQTALIGSTRFFCKGYPQSLSYYEDIMKAVYCQKPSINLKHSASSQTNHFPRVKEKAYAYYRKLLSYFETERGQFGVPCYQIIQ